MTDNSTAIDRMLESSRRLPTVLQILLVSAATTFFFLHLAGLVFGSVTLTASIVAAAFVGGLSILTLLVAPKLTASRINAAKARWDKLASSV
jgi:hypothetical protein